MKNNQDSIKNKIAKFAAVFLLTLTVGALGINHFNTVENNRKHARILADRIPIEALLQNPGSGGQINFRGLLMDVKKEIRHNSLSFVKKGIENANYANGSTKINLDTDLTTVNSRQFPDFEFMLFSEKGKVMRGYLLAELAGKTRVTSVEIPISDLKKISNPHSVIDGNDIPPAFSDIMPVTPELYVKNDIKTGMGIYSCTAKKFEKARLIEMSRRKLIEHGWAVEDWTLPLAEMESSSDFFLSATKDGVFCHLIASENKDNLHLTFRFSGARYASVDHKIKNL